MSRPSPVSLDYRKSLIRSKPLCEQIHAAKPLCQERPPNKDILRGLLNACTAQKGLSAAKRLHSILRNMGVHTISYVGDHLIRMYTSCGRLQDALDAFRQVSHPSVYTWNAIISAHSHLNQHKMALSLFDSMTNQGIVPDKFTFLCTLKASCKIGDHTHCRCMHDLIIIIGLDHDLIVMNTVIDTYAKCGALAESNKVFSRMDVKDVVSWGALITGYVAYNEGSHALELFSEMQEGGNEPHKRLFGSLVKACGGVRAIVPGWWVHDKIIRNGLEGDVVIGSTLVDMYAKCGDMVAARLVFDQIRHRDVVSWTALIAGYTGADMATNALEAYVEMQKVGVKPDNHIFSSVIKASSGMKAVGYGMCVHDQIIRHESGLNVVIGCALVDFYGTCGFPEAALNVFERLPERNILTWGALITCFVQEGHGPFALMLFGKLCEERIRPDEAVLTSILHVCGCLGAADAGYLVHAQIMVDDFAMNDNVRRSLLKMYIESGNLKDAQGTFSMFPTKDGEAWGLIMRGYCQYGEFSFALDAFVDMQSSGVHPSDESVYLYALKACGKMNDTVKGCGIHNQVIKNGWEGHVVVGSALVDMYGSCARMEEARQVFDSIVAPDVVAWGVMMAVYDQHGDAISVLRSYQHMQGGSVKPDKAIFCCLLKACSQTKAIQQGRMIHDHLVRMRLESDAVIENIILDMYANCECLEEAQRVFDGQCIHDAVSWSTIIAAYTQSGHSLASLELFEKMGHEKLAVVDTVLLSCVLHACGFVGFLKNGMSIHDQLIKSGWESKECVVHAIISMYGRCGVIEDAHRVFDMVEDPDESLWGELISAFVMQGHWERALQLYERMQKESLIPNEATAMWVLKACGNKSHIHQGMSLHSHVIKCGHEATMPVANSIVDMYAKCGKMWESSQAFMKMLTRDEVTWSTMISVGMADSGHAGEVRDWVAKMQMDGVHVDGVVHTSLLQACSQAGSMEDGVSCFKSSITAPSIEHYSCMIDLFGRSGFLNAAEDVMQTMPIQNEILTLTSFLNSCRTYCNVRIQNHRVVHIPDVNPSIDFIRATRNCSQFCNSYGIFHIMDQVFLERFFLFSTVRDITLIQTNFNVLMQNSSLPPLAFDHHCPSKTPKYKVCHGN